MIMVVKFGTKNLQDPFAFADFAAQIVEADVGIVAVSSGAIWKGRERMNSIDPLAFLGQEELAGIGSRHLLNAWGNAFEDYNKEVGQIWVTHANLTDMGERESVRIRILNYLKGGVIPIVNENDVVSNKEIDANAVDALNLSGASSDGRGGMLKKVEAAVECFKAGMRVAIAGNEKDVIIKFARGEAVGTAIGTATRFQ